CGSYADVKPLTAEVRSAIATIPPADRQMVAELELGRTEGAPASLAERLAAPALNLSGLAGGRAGGAGANVVGAMSQAYVDFRLVPAQTVERLERLVEAYIGSRGFYVIHADPDSATRRAHRKVIKVTWTGGYPAAKTA